MRKGIQKWSFAVGILVGGAIGAAYPTEAQASEDCQYRCVDEGCTCYYRCFSYGIYCICEDFITCS